MISDIRRGCVIAAADDLRVSRFNKMKKPWGALTAVKIESDLLG